MMQDGSKSDFVSDVDVSSSRQQQLDLVDVLVFCCPDNRSPAPIILKAMTYSRTSGIHMLQKQPSFRTLNGSQHWK